MDKNNINKNNMDDNKSDEQDNNNDEEDAQDDEYDTDQDKRKQDNQGEEYQDNKDQYEDQYNVDQYNMNDEEDNMNDEYQDNQEEDNINDEDQDQDNQGEEDNQEQDEDQEQDEYEEQYEEQDEDAEFNREDILDSIVIARETYIYSYIDENENISDRNERFILKFIYEQLANIYKDVSLIKLLLYIKHYYNLNFPEHDDIFNLFYISVYPQAVVTDRLTAGFIQITDNRNEIPNSFIGQECIAFLNLGEVVNNTSSINSIINNIINPTNDQSNMMNNLFNINNSSNQSMSGLNTMMNSLFNRDSSLNRFQNRDNYNNSLLTEISFLATIFNMQSNESMLHILNLINDISNVQEEKQIASEFQIKELKTKSFNDLDKELLDKNSDFCSICQETYDNDNNQVKILSCGHFFHYTCIEPWLLNCSNLCPICRNKI